MQNVAVFGTVLSRIDPARAVEPGLWSASRYVWHTVDVLRFGTERIWTISADPDFGVPEWDENVVALVRSYDALSPVVGLIALIAAADAWRTVALEAPHDVSTAASRGRVPVRVRRGPAQLARGVSPPVGRPARAPAAWEAD